MRWTNYHSLQPHLGFDVHVEGGCETLIPEKQKKRLLSKRSFLVKQISSLQDLLNELLSKGCITQEHFSFIQQPANCSAKIGQMLDIIQRRSYEHYLLFLECLRSTHPQWLADTVENVGKENNERFLYNCKNILSKYDEKFK